MPNVGIWTFKTSKCWSSSCWVDLIHGLSTHWMVHCHVPLHPIANLARLGWIALTWHEWVHLTKRIWMHWMVHCHVPLHPIANLARLGWIALTWHEWVHLTKRIWMDLTPGVTSIKDIPRYPGEAKEEIKKQSDNNHGEILDEYSSNIKSINEVVLKALARSLKLEEYCFLNQYRTTAKMHERFNYYPPCPWPEKVLGVKPHADGSTITGLLQDKEVESLQLLKDDQWFGVLIVRDALTINVGVIKVYHTIQLL
nr:non-heme dioxygenase N-terminal domain-containing protein [Tanacetum cinerariifolium]